MSPPIRSLSFIPPLLPDQTLYSWVTVFHSLSGNISPDETRLQLFGSAKAGRHFHVPSHLTAFCARTQLTLGDVQEIVATATVLPFFTRFRSRTVAADAVKLVQGSNAAGLLQMLNMENKWPYWPLPRKCCPECILKDRRQFNFSYWRRAHQLPGVLVCHEHGIPLQIEQAGAHNPAPSRFLLPELGIVKSGNRQTLGNIRPQQSTLFRLANLAQNMAKARFNGMQDRNALRDACIRQLALRFQTSPAAHLLDPLKLSADFDLHFKAMAGTPEVGEILHQRGIRALWLLLQRKESHAHPLEWMLIIDWLYGDWETFQQRFHSFN